MTSNEPIRLLVAAIEGQDQQLLDVLAQQSFIRIVRSGSNADVLNLIQEKLTFDVAVYTSDGNDDEEAQWLAATGGRAVRIRRVGPTDRLDAMAYLETHGGGAALVAAFAANDLLDAIHGANEGRPIVRSPADDLRVGASSDFSSTAVEAISRTNREAIQLSNIDAVEGIAREMEVSADRARKAVAAAVTAQLDVLWLWVAGDADDAVGRATLRALWVYASELLKINGLVQLGRGIVELIERADIPFARGRGATVILSASRRPTPLEAASCEAGCRFMSRARSARRRAAGAGEPLSSRLSCRATGALSV